MGHGDPIIEKLYYILMFIFFKFQRYINEPLIIKIVHIGSHDDSSLWHGRRVFPLITAISCVKNLNMEFGEKIKRHPMFDNIKVLLICWLNL